MEAQRERIERDVELATEADEVFQERQEEAFAVREQSFRHDDDIQCRRRVKVSEVGPSAVAGTGCADHDWSQGLSRVELLHPALALLWAGLAERHRARGGG